MAKESNGPDVLEAYFEIEEVRVTVPRQEENWPLSVHRLRFPSVEWKQGDEFELRRPVINFEVQKEDGSVVEEFDPPLELTVGLIADDFEGLGGGDPKLAFWNEDDKRWILFTQKKHRLEIEGFEARVWIEHWGDPGVGLGR
jgi:hypothetical protein